MNDVDATAGHIVVRRAHERAVTDIGWLDSRHSFNFNSHFSPDDTNFGMLVVSNDDRVAPAGGFGEHPHRDMEIVTWVVDGALEHRDTTGTHGTIEPGIAQRMTAGRGIRHSEMNASRNDAVHFVQMWVVPDTAGLEPGYAQADVRSALATGTLVPVASGTRDDAAIHIHQRDATFWVAQPPAGASVPLPDAPFVHVFVATGAASILTADGHTIDLGQGDAARCSDIGPGTITATATGTEILVWEMTATLS